MITCGTGEVRPRGECRDGTPSRSAFTERVVAVDPAVSSRETRYSTCCICNSMAYTKFHATSSGNNCIIAGVAGQNIRIQAIFLQCGALTQVTLRSGTSSSGDMTGPMQFQTGGGLNLPSCGIDLFVCDAGEQFTLNLAGISPDCAGAVLYTQG